MKTFIIIYTAILLHSNLYAKNTMRYDDFINQWNNKATIILDEALQYIASLDQIPTSDGSFNSFINTLTALPFNEKHTSFIITIINRDDPHLQEAGIKLATVSVIILNNHDKYEDTLCNIMQKDIDPWVFYRINEFFKTTYYTGTPPILKFYHNYALLAYNYKKEKNSPMKIMRNRLITPFIDARELIERLVASSSDNNSQIQAIMPVLEKVYKIKGFEKMKEFLRKKIKNN